MASELAAPEAAAPAPPDFDDILAAARALRGTALVTPLLRADALDAATGGRVLVKAEALQVGGSFKIRGALTAIARLSPAQREHGVVAYSSGNHARAVALAAGRFGCAATIVMPSDAPRVKLTGTRDAGAEIVLYDRSRENREAIAAQIARARGAALILPFDHPDTIAGQGTVGNEIADQCRAAGHAPDQVVVPCGGGGLAAGIALALEPKAPATQIWGVEPAGFEDHARSLAAGAPTEDRRASEADPSTLCDGLMAPRPGALTFAVNRSRMAGAVAVTDAEVLTAMRAAFAWLKIVLEPSGAAGLAALLAGRVEAAGRTTVVVASGGNVDEVVFRRAIDVTI